MAVRSRFAEDQLRASLAAGVEQVVILGAGLDTFAYRNPGLCVFEVDHPATQAWKREVLAAANIPIPSSLTFVPVDFETSRLEDALANSGFSTSQSAFFSWLGVVPYLGLEAFRSTVAWIAGLPLGTGVVFDYSVPPDSLGPQARAAFDALAARVAGAGEPFQLFLEQHQVASLLRKLGFHHVQDLGPAEIHQQYFATRADGLRAGPLGHLLCAQV